MASIGAEDQSVILEEAFGFVAEQRFYLRKAIQHSDMEMALRYGLCLANELRTSKLLPENYYKLYALVFWELQHVAAFVADTDRHGLDVSEVYELVQYEGNVLPRLYLLVTVGAVQIETGTTSNVLDDLSEMLAAVQHPMRGLYLRYFLLQMVKDKLLKHRGPGGALQYLLLNLRESVSLWSRLRLEDGGSRTSADEEMPAIASEAPGPEVEQTWRLDRSRHSLRLLVSAHVMHVARLLCLSEGGLQLHGDVVLPEILRQITACEDAAGQAHLLQCFVEALPERFHLATLERVLAACAQVHWAVDLRPLLQHLLRRLVTFARAQQNPGDAEGPFELFQQHFRVLHARCRSPATPLASLVELQLDLVMASLSLHPGDVQRVEQVLCGTVDFVDRRHVLEGEQLDSRSVRAMVMLLAAPLTQAALVPRVLELAHHSRLMALLGRTAQREAAVAMISAILQGDVALDNCETLRRLLLLLDRLVRDEGGDGQGCDAGKSPVVYSANEGGVAGDLPDIWRHLEHDPEAFTVEQEKVARLVHQVRHPDPDMTFKMLKVLRGFFNEGGPHRIVFTLPALVTAALRLVSMIIQSAKPADGAVLCSGTSPKTTINDIFLFCHGLCSRLGALAPEETLRLWLLCASVTERASVSVGVTDGLRATCYKFVESGLASLEANPQNSDSGFRGLQLVVGTLRQLTCLRGSSYERAAERAVLFGTDLPSIRLQSKALRLCSGLFEGPACRQPSRALACLCRSLRFAERAVHIDPMDVSLFVEVLDEAVQHFGHGNDDVTAPFLSGLQALCEQHQAHAPVEALRGLHVALASLRGKQAQAENIEPPNEAASDEEPVVDAKSKATCGW